MWICLCKGVSDRKIRQVIRAGARTMEDIARATAAGTDCGKCLVAIRELLGEAGIDAPELATPPEPGENASGLGGGDESMMEGR